jgi:hypothetical protein
VRSDGGCGAEDVECFWLLEEYHKTEIFALPTGIKVDGGFGIEELRRTCMLSRNASEGPQNGRVREFAAFVFTAKDI